MAIPVLTAFFVLGAVAPMLQSAEIPRTPSGRPDLSGTYDVATRTPLERPEELGEMLILPDAGAAKIAGEIAAFVTRSQAASDPNREAPPKGGDGSPGAAGNVGGYNSLYLELGDGAFKIDGKWRSSIITAPKHGRKPPLTEEAAQRAAERAALERPNNGTAWWIEEELEKGPYDDPELRPLGERCLLGFGSTAGPPMLPVAYNNVKRVVQTEEHVMILSEMVHDARIIRLDADHAPADVRSWLGDSVGHWDGDTLVVDTTNFNDTPALSGASRNLHVVERFSWTAEGALLYQFTVEDPTVWTAPWSGEYVWPPTDSRAYEYACHEANYSFRGILRGARVLEAEASGKTSPE